MNITYFTGAGASFHSLPLIKTMTARMRVFSNYLKHQKFSQNISQDNKDLFINDLDKLIIECENNTSIDTYAKQLSISKKDIELHRLKILLSGYLIFEQLIKPIGLKLDFESSLFPIDLCNLIERHLDKRYKNFWMNMIEPSTGLPNPTVSIVSWNYDMQFEFAYSLISSKDLDSTQHDLQVFPSIINEQENKGFRMVKLNGTAGLYEQHPYNKYDNSFDLSKHHLDEFNLGIIINGFTKNYRRAMENPVFQFAWEQTKLTDRVKNYSKEIISNSEILVFIGYSFPTFNKSVDSEILGSLPNLKKVYLQMPSDTLEETKYRMEAINPKLVSNLMLKSDVSEFYIPTEL